MPLQIDAQQLHDEVHQEFADAQLELVSCTLCGDIHPPDLHLAPARAFDLLDDPPEA